MTARRTIGFLGLGIMGLAMAKNALAKGFSVVAHSRSEEKRDGARQDGIAVLDEPRAVAERSDAIVTIVTDPQAVSDLLLRPGGVFEVPVAEKTLIQMSTIDEASTLRFAAEAEKRGMLFLDCPVAGSKKQVEAGELILLAGGPASVVNAWRAFLLAVGKHIVHAGDVGKGTALKLCMNLIVAQMTTALCEAVALARAQCIDPATISEVLSNSPALNCGYFSIKMQALLEDAFAPSFALENMLKDVRFMDAAATERGLTLPVTQAVLGLMENALAAGHGKEDLTASIKALRHRPV